MRLTMIPGPSRVRVWSKQAEGFVQACWGGGSSMQMSVNIACQDVGFMLLCGRLGTLFIVGWASVTDQVWLC